MTAKRKQGNGAAVIVRSCQPDSFQMTCA